MPIAMILAGGTGSRVGADRPKQFIEVCGKPIVAHTIELYQEYPDIEAIEIVCCEDWIDYLEKVVENQGYSKVKWLVKGGSNFQNSVINGMNYLKDKIPNDEIIAIHYGASPFTDKNIITDALKVCKEKGMSVSCTPCYQLCGSNDRNGESKNWVDRDKIIQIACPQCFTFGYLTNIYDRAEKHGILESTEPHITSLMYALGDTVYQSYGNQTNIKITTQGDVELFRALKGADNSLLEEKIRTLESENRKLSQRISEICSHLNPPE